MSCGCAKKMFGGANNNLGVSNPGANVVANSVLQAATMNTTPKNQANMEQVVNATIETAQNQSSNIPEAEAANNVAIAANNAANAANAANNKGVANVVNAANVAAMNVNAGVDKFDILMRLIRDAGLEQNVQALENATLFAPNDKAWTTMMALNMRTNVNKLNKNQINKIINETIGDDEQKEMLKKVILYHIVSGRVNLNKNKTQFNTKNGNVKMNIVRNGNRVEVGGIEAKPALIPGLPESVTVYAIDQVLMPPMEAVAANNVAGNNTTVNNAAGNNAAVNNAAVNNAAGNNAAVNNAAGNNAAGNNAAVNNAAGNNAAVNNAAVNNAAVNNAAVNNAAVNNAAVNNAAVNNAAVNNVRKQDGGRRRRANRK